MSDENENTTDVSEFDVPASPAATNKDLWLFLIVLDVIFLCIFGFFLYKNLSATLLIPPFEIPETEKAAVQDIQEEVTLSQVLALAPQVSEEATPVQTTEKSVSTEEIVLPVALVANPAEDEKATMPIEKKEEVPAPAEKKEKASVPVEKKESVLIHVNPRSKYRQVTFRYFEPATTVAVVSGFTMAKPREMTQKNGVWETTLAISPGTYKYLLVVDGVQQTDPHAPEKDGRSVLVVK